MNIINGSITSTMFDQELKYADLMPVHKKDDITDKNNYRPISHLPVVSKIFERILQNQMGKYVDTFLSPHSCGYRKGYNSQHALLSLIEKWRISLEKKGFGVRYSWIFLRHLIL